MQALQRSGVDIIELGMPYSDPLADGPVIQESSAQALANGMSITTLFHQLKNFRSQIHIPVVLMGYLNPLLQFGFENFCTQAAAIGVDGLIIPDIPAFEFEQQYAPGLKKHILDFIFMITPETSEGRIRQLYAAASGFLYAVSSSSVTGSNKSFGNISTYLQRLAAMSLNNPVLVGFGVRDKASFEAASAHTAGAIVGSAYINMLKQSQNIAADTEAFFKNIRPA